MVFVCCYSICICKVFKLYFRHPNNSNIVEGMVKALARVVSTVHVSDLLPLICIFITCWVLLFLDISSSVLLEMQNFRLSSQCFSALDDKLILFWMNSVFFFSFVILLNVRCGLLLISTLCHFHCFL